MLVALPFLVNKVLHILIAIFLVNTPNIKEILVLKDKIPYIKDQIDLATARLKSN